jgi:hypothetical protein
MRPPTRPLAVQALALLALGVFLLVYSAFLSASIQVCGAFLICQGSILPPFSNVDAVLEWSEHFLIVAVVVLAAITILVIVMALRKLDFELLIELRRATFFFALQGIIALVMHFTPFSSAVLFHYASAALILVVFIVLSLRLLYVDEADYNDTVLAGFLYGVAAISVLPYVINLFG